MKRLLALFLALVMMTALLAGCGSPAADNGDENNDAADDSNAAETYTLKLHITVPETDVIGQTVQKFKEIVEERTDGRVNIQIYPSSTLGNTADCLEGLSMGICDIVFDGLVNLAAYDQIANLDGVLYLYDNLDHYYAVWDGELGDEIRAEYSEKTGKQVLGFMCTGPRQLTTTRPIHSVDELDGIKLRMANSPIYLDSWTWLGASPTVIASGDIFSSLQQHVIDGQENPYPTCIALSIQEVCKYVTETSHTYTTLGFVMDPTFYASLPEDIQQIMAEAALEAGRWGTDAAFAVADEKKQEMVDAGCEIIETDVSAWEAAMDGFIEAKHPYLVEWVERIKNTEY